MSNPSDTANINRNAELPPHDHRIAELCTRRGYAPWLFRFLLEEKLISVTGGEAGLFRLHFLFGDEVAQECVNTGSRLLAGAEATGVWVWKGPRDGGACLVVSQPIDLMEIGAAEPRLINQLGLVIAGVSLEEIPGLISDMVIKDTLLVAVSCYGKAQTNIRVRAKINGVALFVASPDPYPDWAQLRDIHATGEDPLANRAMRGLHKSVSHIVAHHLRTGRIGGIEIKLPR